jgi:hypothetical protein
MSEEEAVVTAGVESRHITPGARVARPGAVTTARSVQKILSLTSEAGARRLFLEGAGVGRDVDGILPEHVQRDDLQSALVGRRQHHRGGGAVAMRP